MKWIEVELMKVGTICLGQWIHRLIIIDMGIMMEPRTIYLLLLRLNLQHQQRWLCLTVLRPPVRQAYRTRARVLHYQRYRHLQTVRGD